MKNKEYYIEEYINYLYGGIEEEDRPIYQPEITQSRADFKSGFNLAEELFKPKWISVDEQTPKFNEPTLVKYIKGKQGEVITQGYFKDEAQSIADRHLENANKPSSNKVETVEFWRSQNYGLTWFDDLGRQIQYLGAKTSKNKVTHWMEIPE